MKNLLLLFSFLMLNLHVGAQTNFLRSQDWEAIKNDAKKGQKLIFIDAYTDWCGWCKVMDEKTFSNEAIGKMMNQYFINLKLEMEKDDLGKQIALKYATSSFPTFLVFNADGALVYQSFGYQAPEQFMKTLFLIINPANHIQRPGYSASFDVKYPDFYLKAMGQNGKRKFPKTDDLNKWVAANNDLSQEANWTVYQRFYSDMTETNRNHFWTQKRQLDELYGHDMVNDLATNLLYYSAQNFIKENNPKAFEAFLKSKLPEIDNADQVGKDLRLSFYKGTANWIEVNKILTARFKETGIDNPEWWNQQCWDIYETSNDSTILKQAVIWIEKTVAISPEYNYIDTYAALLFKTGRLEEAEVKAGEAIAVGKSTNTAVAGTEDLLKKIAAAKATRDAAVPIQK